MPKNHLVKFLVDEQQFSRIRNNAAVKGHKTVSSYLRDIALNKDIRMEEILIEIHKEVVHGRAARMG